MKKYDVWCDCTTLGRYDDLDAAVRNADKLIRQYMEHEEITLDDLDESERPLIAEVDMKEWFGEMKITGWSKTYDTNGNLIRDIDRARAEMK